MQAKPAPERDTKTATTITTITTMRTSNTNTIFCSRRSHSSAVWLLLAQQNANAKWNNNKMAFNFALCGYCCCGCCCCFRFDFIFIGGRGCYSVQSMTKRLTATFLQTRTCRCVYVCVCVCVCACSAFDALELSCQWPKAECPIVEISAKPQFRHQF